MIEKQANENGGEEESLDPQDWGEMRQLGYRMIDDMMNYLETVRERPVWEPVPDATKQSFKEKLPLAPSTLESVYQNFLTNIMPYPTGNIHPRFWGWVMGNGTPLAMLADMLASGMNSHVGGYEQSAAYVEKQVIEWMKELMDFTTDSSGLLVTGGTAANLVGLTVARHAKAGFDIRERGLQQTGEPPLLVYCSTETHSWAQKSVELLGLGNQSLKRIPVNENFEIDAGALLRQIKEDRAGGARPICVIGNAGTVNTGATDDLTKLAEICRNEDLWFHVDGAFGALALLSPKYKSLMAGIEQADSLAFDLHKWMYLPYEVGCVLVKNREAHHDTFALTPSYLTSATRGIMGGELVFANLGLQLSRGFRALKVWMSLKAHGVNLFGRLIEQNIEQAQYLSHLIKAEPELELLAPVPLNVVCFRFQRGDLSDAELNELNEEIMVRIQEMGLAVMSATVIKGQFALRVANTNHRSLRSDFDLLVKAVVEVGNQIINSEVIDYAAK